jgi:hypothetical protein
MFLLKDFYFCPNRFYIEQSDQPFKDNITKISRQIW